MLVRIRSRERDKFVARVREFARRDWRAAWLGCSEDVGLGGQVWRGRYCR